MEKRKIERIRWTTDVFVFEIGDMSKPVAKGRLRNLNRYGFSFISLERLSVQKTFVFRFRMGAFPWPLQAKIVRCHQKDKFDPWYHIGAEMGRLTLFQRIHLNKFLASQSSAHDSRFQSIALSIGVAVGVVLFGALYYWAPLPIKTTLAISLTGFVVVWSALSMIKPF